MAQVRTFSWTNPSTKVAKNFNVGFAPAECYTVDTTNGGSWYWNSEMADAAVLDVDAGTFATSNGFTPLSQNANFGAQISAFTNANPGVITVGDTAAAGFAAGDTVQVGNVAESGAGASLNRNDFVVASVTATTITLVDNTTSDAVYVSGGQVVRRLDANSDAVPRENFAMKGITVGTTPVGANSAAMVMVCRGDEHVS